MSRRLEKDWKWIRAQYGTGLPIRKIAELYSDHFPGESVSHQNISAYARRHDWSRDKLVKAVTIERKSWNMDKNDGAPGDAGAVIQVNINVPEPEPLPERSR